MAGKRFQGDHGCCQNRADGSCAPAMVGRLSEERVRELAEDIWTASTGTVVPARPSPDPQSSRPRAAEAAYRRRRQQEREAWRPGWQLALLGWPAGLDHLCAGCTGRRRPLPTLWLPAPRSLSGRCYVSTAARPGTARSLQGLRVATPRQLDDVVRQPPPPPPRKIERATARALEVLRPAA
jgi:hypothetical protein